MEQDVDTMPPAGGQAGRHTKPAGMAAPEGTLGQDATYRAAVAGSDGECEGDGDLFLQFVGELGHGQFLQRQPTHF